VSRCGGCFGVTSTSLLCPWQEEMLLGVKKYMSKRENVKVISNKDPRLRHSMTPMYTGSDAQLLSKKMFNTGNCAVGSKKNDLEP
jgi:hypothetical protein